MRGPVKVAPVETKQSKGYIGHMLRRTHKRDMGSVEIEERRTYRTGQSGRMIFITIPAIPYDGKSSRE